jgi:putative ABC transport system ATP-binding protein
MKALELHDVSKRHAGSPPVTALASVTLNIAIGELVGVIGPSGSGKSTLLAIAGTLDRPTSGQVKLNGTPVQHLTDRQLSAVRAHHIGFVFQQFFLMPTLSALDNVAGGLLYRGSSRSARRRAAAEALQEVGLGHRLAHRPTELSGGECQRVAIARALVGRPGVLLADEPTGNLDSRQSEEIMHLITDLNRNGTTIVVVTHNPAVADGLPRIIRLRDGTVIADSGTVGEGRSA